MNKIEDNENFSFSNEIKKARFRRRLKPLLAIFNGILIITLVVLYFATPISKSSNVELSGNVAMTKADIDEIMHNDDSLIMGFDSKKASELLDNYPLISESKITKYPFYLKIEISEITPLCKIGENIYFTDGLRKDEYLDEELFESIYDRYSKDVPTLVSSTLSESDYKSFFSPLANITTADKEYIDYFGPHLESKVTYDFYVSSPSYNFYYRFTYLVDDISQYMNKTIIHDYGVFFAEEKFKNGELDYNNYLQDVKINDVDLKCVNLAWSHQNHYFHFAMDQENVDE